MRLREEISLKPYNTFGIDVRARFFTEALTEEDVIGLAGNLQDVHLPLLILGGGSNILFTKDFPGTVMKISMKGIRVIKEDEETVWVKASAGENWDDLVKFCVDKGWGGLENLSAIPGTAGTSPVQNIGAYGVEMKDTFCELEAFDLESREKGFFQKRNVDLGIARVSSNCKIKAVSSFSTLPSVYRKNRYSASTMEISGKNCRS